ncbi:hypothetical protein [Kribbella sp. NPDC048915]|uniref:hypothetical protein n=1 Tax=Kribbella sp. NPDC048915 TaxID=3155148 RepID=UPI0033C230DD
MRIGDITRLPLGTFVRSAAETGTGQPRVEPVLGYVARTPAGTLLLDTGLGDVAPLPPTSPWMASLLSFDPKRVFFAHDAAVWIPPR